MRADDEGRPADPGQPHVRSGGRGAGPVVLVEGSRRPDAVDAHRVGPRLADSSLDKAGLVPDGPEVLDGEEVALPVELEVVDLVAVEVRPEDIVVVEVRWSSSQWMSATNSSSLS